MSARRKLQFQRSAPTSRAEASAAWRELIAQAGDYARRAALTKEEAYLFLGRIVRVTKMPFPLAHASATEAAKAFGLVARAFVMAARDDEREALGELMGDGARCLERLLVAEAQRSRRMAGEVD